MADARRTWTIRICHWREFQNYKDRHPPWIKLHQARLLDKPEWRRLHGSAAKLLVDLWMLAAGTEDGELTERVENLSYRFRTEESETLADLRVLEAFEFVELGASLQADASARTQAHTNADKRNPEQRRGETETEESQRADRAQPETPVSGNWVTEFGVAWKARFGGTIPYKRIGHALKPLRADYSDAEILSRWERYLSRVEGQYASAEDFAKKFGEWKPQLAPTDTRITKDVAIRRALTVLRGLDEKRIPRDGFSDNLAFETWLTHERERQEDDAA